MYFQSNRSTRQEFSLNLSVCSPVEGSVSNHGHVNLDDQLVWGKDRFGSTRAVQLQSREQPESARPALQARTGEGRLTTQS